jgi:hypothetical protein
MAQTVNTNGVKVTISKISRFASFIMAHLQRCLVSIGYKLTKIPFLTSTQLVTLGPDPTFVDGAAKVGYDPKMQRFCNAANVGFSSSTDVLL